MPPSEVPSSYVIISDTREKLPLGFPQYLSILDPRHHPHNKRSLRIRLTIVKKALQTGDYVLQGHESRCIIERKGSLREVVQNVLSQDRERFVRQIDRLAEACSSPVLLLEGKPSDLQARNVLPEAALAIDGLQRLLHDRSITLLLLPGSTTLQRRAMGEWVARLLINATLGNSDDQHPSTTPVPA